MKNIIILLLFVFISSTIAEKPGIETIKELCNTTEKWSILEIKQINQSKDNCWLAVIDVIPDRGACCSPIVVLVDKKNNWAKELKEFELTYKVQDFDVNEDGISELIITTGFGRGGFNERTLSLVQIVDRNVTVLYSNNAYDAQGTCREEVEDRNVTWSITDVDDDGISELVETVTISDCIGDDNCEYTCDDDIKKSTHHITSFTGFVER